MNCRGFGLAAFLFLLLGAADISANKGGSNGIRQQAESSSTSRVIDEHRAGSPVSECKDAREEFTCRATNGCSWCLESEDVGKSQRRDSSVSKSKRGSRKEVGSGSPHCVRWENCVAPDGLCELRNATICQVGIGGQAKDKYSCRWCESEARCVQAAEDHKDGSGQCRGCDGVFDSGVRIDSCGICGGSVS
jgi:hypothetical protein